MLQDEGQHRLATTYQPLYLNFAGETTWQPPGARAARVDGVTKLPRQASEPGRIMVGELGGDWQVNWEQKADGVGFGQSIKSGAPPMLWYWLVERKMDASARLTLGDRVLYPTEGVSRFHPMSLVVTGPACILEGSSRARLHRYAMCGIFRFQSHLDRTYCTVCEEERIRGYPVALSKGSKAYTRELQ
nr:hypothetical protein CFP56_12984 [Quercus suber]